MAVIANCRRDSSTTASDASGQPSRKASPTVPAISALRCGTRVTTARSRASSQSSSGNEPIVICPASGSSRRAASSSNVLLPDPLGPVMATLSPAEMARDTLSRTGWSARSRRKERSLIRNSAVSLQSPSSGAGRTVLRLPATRCAATVIRPRSAIARRKGAMVSIKASEAKNPMAASAGVIVPLRASIIPMARAPAATTVPVSDSANPARRSIRSRSPRRRCRSASVARTLSPWRVNCP
jgi:hypothetical protein